MTDRAHGQPMRVAVLGAGGRAGGATIRELVARGHRVTGVVRDARRHSWLTAFGIEVVEGDATRGSQLAGALREVEVVVVAVTPFAAPPVSFDGFDESFFERVLTAVLSTAQAVPATRLIIVGHFATLRMPHGRSVMDDPDLFPPQLRPFARAHARELPFLRRRAPNIDWLILTPPAGLHNQPTTATGYVLTNPPLEPPQISSTLSYDQLAQAIADQAEAPTLHHAQVAVLQPSST